MRRRVQNETLKHRGRKDDPLYRIRKLLLTGTERLDHNGTDRILLGLRVGDPYDEVAGAWLAKESVRDIYLVDDPNDAATLIDDPNDAATLIDKAIVACRSDDSFAPSMPSRAISCSAASISSLASLLSGDITHDDSVSDGAATNRFGRSRAALWCGALTPHHRTEHVCSRYRA